MPEEEQSRELTFMFDCDLQAGWCLNVGLSQVEIRGCPDDWRCLCLSPLTGDGLFATVVTSEPVAPLSTPTPLAGESLGKWGEELMFVEQPQCDKTENQMRS